MSYRSPRQSLSKAYLKSPISRPEIEQFKNAFVAMQDKIDPDELEEHLKNNIRDFLLDAYYKDEYEINVKGTQDLVIHNGPKTSDSVGVIIEAKSIKNKAEMITKAELNKKALQELILYYLRERVDGNNISIKHLIITNANEWFVFDANQFENLIYRNAELLRKYKEDYKGNEHKTNFFYDQIAKPFIDTIKDELEYTYFDISKYQNVITNNDEKDDVKLIALFKLLSPTHILKKPFSNDSNSLNKDFYNELLHIIGLEEIKEKNKKVIQRKAEGKREPASLVENTINILKYETNVAESKRYETALELCITWINRILFLKLLESQLIKYHKGDKSFQFLNYAKVKDYDTLNRLFFQVLAIRPEDRRPEIQEAYAKVPYLNSSLFEVNDLESKTLKISGLEDSDLLSIFSKTVLKGEKGRRASGGINTLEYLFKFLEAYNFSSEGGEQIQEESKTLINASVLGLIFEKINGYKDGSFFTPGFITMYMCKETIRRAVVQKFTDNTDFDSEDWDELKNYIGKPYKKDELKTYNELIDSLKICDPAVGSGHFLVSALNEILAIKSELKILCDIEYVKLPILASVDNDELILEVKNEDHDLYEYDYSSEESRRIQKAIFKQKQKIIENCLFGVDINPNSVKICRLRLWIELLKNAYYTEESNFTDLETLPNIDINIKCGNSLISRFDLDSDLKPALKKSKFSIDSYKAAVASYKGATNKEEKHEFKSLIDGIKNDFRSEVRGKELLGLQKLEGQFYERFGAATLLDVELSKTEAKKKAKEQKKLVDRIDKKKKEIDEVRNNKIYVNAFEWRFEFPEVLDDDGGYIGFDVVIGNPPYIQIQNDEFISQSLMNMEYNSFHRSGDLYVIFCERSNQIIKSQGSVSLIIPNKWLNSTYGSNLRNYLANNTCPIKIVDFESVFVFEEAVVFVCILEWTKKAFKGHIKGAKIIDKKDMQDFAKFIEQPMLEVLEVSNKPWKLVGKGVASINKKIETNGKKLSTWKGISFFRGITTGNNKAFHITIEERNEIIEEDQNSQKLIKPLLRGKDIKRYLYINSNLYIIFTRRGIEIDKYQGVKNHLLKFYDDLIPKTNNEQKKGRKPGNYKWFEIQDNTAYFKEFENDKIVWMEISDKANFTFDNSKKYLTNSAYFISGRSLKYLLAVLNSKLCDFYFFQNTAMIAGKRKRYTKQYVEQNYIPDLKTILQKPFINLVDKIIEQRKNSENTAHLESQIDQLVYQLYDLTPEEIKIIEENT